MKFKDNIIIHNFQMKFKLILYLCQINLAKVLALDKKE